MSRFLAKVAIECLALRMINSEGNAEFVISEPTLDTLRDYARRGPQRPIWPFSTRFLYTADFLFQRTGVEPYEVLHEWDFLRVEKELYLVLAIFGVEYAINVVRRSVDSYGTWLVKNEQKSKLYPDVFG